MTPKLIELHPRLFIRGHTKNVLSDVMLRALQEKHISYVLNVALIPDPFLHSACRTIGMSYKHVPLHDSAGEISEQIPALIEEVRLALAYTGVLIHCDSGFNRSALIAIPALSLFTGKPTKDIISEIRLVRPRVLHNKVFEDFVLRYTGAGNGSNHV